MLPVSITDRRGRWRRAFGLLHLWTGLVLCLPLVALGVTGSVLVFGHELEGLLDEGPPRVAAPGQPRPFGEILAAAEAAAPAGQAPSLVTLPTEPDRAAAVRFAPRGAGPGAATVVFVDPATLAVLGTRERSGGIVRQIHLLHANLMVRDRIGRAAVGWLGVAMLALGVSGVVLWWPRRRQWRGAFGVRRKARGARFHRELHGAAGGWGLGVFLVVSFSGVYLAFPQAIGGAVQAVSSARDPRASPRVEPGWVEPRRGAPPMAVDEAVALARAAAPGATAVTVALPTRPDQPIRVSLMRDGQERDAPTAVAFVDPGRRRVIELRDPREFSPAESFLAWQRPLHAGRGFGPVWRALVFLSGFLPLLFAVTGVSMWWLKRRARRAGEARRTAALQPGE